MEDTREPIKSSVGLFEIIISILLFAPIVFFIFSYFFGQSCGLFFSLLLPISLVAGLRHYLWKKLPLKLLLVGKEIETFIFWFASFTFFLWACLQWPDFIAMGERLRDYALLSSVTDSPIVAQEPWMVGENLNYYLYWYRFAAYWSGIFGVSVWNTYHLLAAFSFSLFATTLFRLMRCYLELSFKTAFLLAILIVVGSNFAGITNAFSDSSDWWGPSRVIKGTINEFPAWSFLLGDLHPHFLNLALTPFILCLAFAFINTTLTWAGRLGLVLLLFLIGGALQYNCNAWEVPMAGMTFITALLLAAFGIGVKRLPKLKQFPILFLKELKNPAVLIITTSLILCLISLVLSSRNIQPAGYPWRWVKPPIPASSIAEIFRHWGIPLLTIFTALVIRLGANKTNSLACAIVFAVAIATQNSLFALSALTLWVIFEAAKDLRTFELNKTVLLYTLGISSLVLIMLGELIFLDDPYGGENERMNTIFKIYSAVWGPLHVFAFGFLYRTLAMSRLIRLTIPGAIILSASLPAFFFHTINLRKNSNPSMEGLASIEQQFPGSADAIRYLRQQPRRTVLEAQGNPYSYTTHVGTLGNQNSYLGWANHVGLLTGKHDEVGRREKITEQIFAANDCASKMRIANEEKIDLVVIGALERQKYGEQVGNNFSCFTKVFEDVGYLILAVKGK